MKKILLTPFILLAACMNNQNTTTDERTDMRFSTIEQLIDHKLTPKYVIDEVSAFQKDFNVEIKQTLQIVETIKLDNKYFWTFIEFTLGAIRYREVVRTKKIFDSSFIQNYNSCFTLDCPDELEDKIKEWEKNSISKKLE